MATKKTQLKSAKKTNKVMTLTARKAPVNGGI
jgi:hypothetical protein